MNDTEFSGGVFSQELPHGRSGASIQLDRDRIVARTDENRQFSLPYSDCRLSIGGASGRMVFCRSSDRELTIFCEDKRFVRALEQESGGLLLQELANMRQVQRSDRSSSRRWGTVVLIGLIITLVLGYFAVRHGATLAARSLPISVDERIGKLAMSQMDFGGPEIHDPVIEDAIQQIVDRLAPHAAVKGFEFDVHIVRSDQINAFALPGGPIVVYTGLIDASDTPEQVAGVLGHEMAHVTLRHSMERIGQSLGIAAAIDLMIGNVEGIIAAGVGLFELASVNHYGRGQESAADAEGLRMLHAAKIDPQGLPKFFETLKEEHDDVPGVLAWISTHPDHDTRITSLNAQIATLPAVQYEPLKIDWKKVQAAAATPNGKIDGVESDDTTEPEVQPVAEETVSEI